MPVYACSQPFCPTVLAIPGYCPTHRSAREKLRQSTYDTQKRDKIATSFYGSQAWANCRLQILSERVTCEACRDALASDVHHVRPLSIAWTMRLTPSNLQAVCGRCHKRIELHRRKTGSVTSIPEVFFDPDK